MTDEPDFSEFEDWLQTGTIEPWPDPTSSSPLTQKQQGVVARNAELLLQGGGAWQSKVERFERALNVISSKKTRNEKRAQYRIRFDFHHFRNHGHDFSKHSFPCAVSFARAEFHNGFVSFHGTDFRAGEVSFHGTQFHLGGTSFSSAKFKKVSFERAQFRNGTVSFDHTDFGNGYTSFQYAKFKSGDVVFESAVFGSRGTNFEQTTFEVGNAFFGRVDFGEGDLSFVGAKFIGADVRFIETRFGSGKLSLERVTVEDGLLSLEPIELNATEMSLKDCTIDGSLFVVSSFPLTSDFRRLSVSETANFSGCIFESKIPDFRDAKFGRPPEVARMQVPDPKMIRNGLFNHAKDKDDAPKLRKLKSMALDAHDHSRDGYFFALEMRAKRGVETTGFWPLLLDTAYWQLSDYGQSVWYPIRGFITSFIGFWAIYALFILTQAMPLEKSLWFTAQYSLRNTFPFLNSLIRFTPKPTDPGYSSSFDEQFNQIYVQADGLVDVLGRFAIGQQIIGAILLFLLLLGLRNKFRMK